MQGWKIKNTKPKKGDIFLVILMMITITIVLSLCIAPHGGGAEIFRGTILENRNGQILIAIDPAYREILSLVGDTVLISRDNVLQTVTRENFDKYPDGEYVQVVYNRIKYSDEKIRVLAIYLVSELALYGHDSNI